MNRKSNKKVALVGFMLAALCASPALAADVHWKHMVGVITATDNPATPAAENFNSVGSVQAATFAWSVRDGHARVDLDTGNTDFEVHGLVIIGTIFSGTAGPVNAVTGTLVCNPGDQTEEVELDTSDVSIDAGGNARFTGMIPGIPATCANPVFLVRIATIANPQNPNGARGFWIATGTEPQSRP
jgi:opacity protein-like surface antigen